MAYANVVAGSEDQNVGVVEFTCLSDAEAAIGAQHLRAPWLLAGVLISCAAPSPTAMFDGKEVAGSVVTVALSDEPQEPTVSATKVFVNSLAYSVDSADLIDHFSSAGDVVSANVFTYGGRSKVRAAARRTGCEQIGLRTNRCTLARGRVPVRAVAWSSLPLKPVPPQPSTR